MFLQFLSFIAVFFVTLNYVDTEKKSRRLILAVIISGFLYSLYGIIRKIYVPLVGFSTFTNKNHFAAYAEMVIPLGICYSLTEFSKKVREEYAVFARGSVLDIGCGAGIQVFQLGELGADVTGIDFSEKMILMANEVLKSYRGKGNVDFICAGLCSFNFERKFDMVIALGLFDYVSEPLAYLSKMKSLANRVVIASFPRGQGILALQRKLRYRFIKKCPLYLYTKEELTDLIERCSFRNYSIERIHRDYLIKCYI